MYNQYLTQIQDSLSPIPDETLLNQSYSSITESEHLEKFPNGKGRKISHFLFPGATLVFREYLAEQVSCHHKADAGILEINYCRYGRIGWNMQDGHSIYLGPGDFSIHTRQLCAGSVMVLPSRHYAGFTLYIDLAKFDRTPPGLLTGTGITGQMLSEKFCPQEAFTTFIGNEKTESIFAGFYDKPEKLRFPYYALKTLELLLYLGEQETFPEKEIGKYQSGQVDAIRQIHNYLLQHMDKKITIDELSRQYLMNPTTLKSVFKAVYGDSLAAHIKEHRLEHAASLLTETDDSIAQIAKAAGYGSPSKFSTAFQEVYQCLPSEYRKMHSGSRVG